MLEIKNVSKIFPGVKALEDVSINFEDGEIHALLGENGAGKSTLINVICGLHRPDSGGVYIDQEIKHFQGFDDALKNGISLVSQEIQVIPESSIAENIMLDKIQRYLRFGMIQWKALFNDTRKYLDLVGLNRAPQDKIMELSVAEKQLVQIAKALASDAKILLLDEPTSSLTMKETNNLLDILRNIRAEGNRVIIFVSHKLEEVLELCDKFSVLRDGKFIATKYCRDVTKQDIVKMMIGREANEKFLGFLDASDEIVLEVKGLNRQGLFGKTDFYLKKGEILGFYGLVGSGRTELARLIIGAEQADEGEVWIGGGRAYIKSVSDGLEKYKVGYVSENRKEEGLILNDSVKTNICITVWKTIRNRLKLINTKKEENIADRWIRELEVKTTGRNQTVLNLSGGNQQKLCFAKWLAADCDILIIDEPTVGVDIGAKESIHDMIWDMAKSKGKSVILISSDMPELIKLSRRILIFKEFNIVNEISGLNERETQYSEVSDAIGKHLA